MPFPINIQNIALIALAALCAFLGFQLWMFKGLNEELTVQVGEQASTIATLEGNIKFQNTKIAELGKKTEEYKQRLNLAYQKNEESKKKLNDKLREIDELKLPKDCDGKIEYLKSELIKLGGL